MSAESTCLDTNLLFYAVDPKAGEKHLRAQRILAQLHPLRTIVLLQTLGELCFSVARKRPESLPEAHRLVDILLRLYPIAAAQSSDLREAIVAQQDHGFSFWDAMLWATARRTGCTQIFSEDFQDGRTLGGVVFRNPFTVSELALAALLR